MTSLFYKSAQKLFLSGFLFTTIFGLTSNISLDKNSASRASYFTLTAHANYISPYQVKILGQWRNSQGDIVIFTPHGKFYTILKKHPEMLFGNYRIHTESSFNRISLYNWRSMEFEFNSSNELWIKRKDNLFHKVSDSTVIPTEIKNPAASGRGMKQPFFDFFRRPKGRGIYP